MKTIPLNSDASHRRIRGWIGDLDDFSISKNGSSVKKIINDVDQNTNWENTLIYDSDIEMHYLELTESELLSLNSGDTISWAYVSSSTRYVTEVCQIISNNLDTILTSISGNVDNVENNIDTINTNLINIDSSLSLISTDIDSINSSTQSISGDINNITDDISSINLSLIDLTDEAFGKWIINPTAKTLTLYRVDGVTVLKTFNLTEGNVNEVKPYTTRTPV